MGGVDAHRPGQIRRATVQLLVEPVAPATQTLGEHEAGRDAVGDGRHLYASAAAPDVGAHGSDRDRSGDAEPALPELQLATRTATLAEVLGPAGEHVVQPATDQTERHRPGGDLVDDPDRTTASAVPVIGEQRGR